MNELVHSMVSSGCVSAELPTGGPLKEEAIFPPKELSHTQATLIGAGLIQNVELLCGCPFEEALQKIAARFKTLNFILVGDGYSANLRFVNQFFSFLLDLADSHDPEEWPVTCCAFTCCFLHQMARVLSIHIDHRSLTAPLYSITRLNLHQTSRDMVYKSMKLLLRQRFQFVQAAPPESFLQSPHLKAKFLDLLGGTWTGEADSDEGQGQDTLSARQQLLREAIDFFNGDLLSSDCWVHYCQGCHANEKEALDHAPTLSLVGEEGHCC